jgi:cytochrome c5
MDNTMMYQDLLKTNPLSGQNTARFSVINALKFPALLCLLYISSAPTYATSANWQAFADGFFNNDSAAVSQNTCSNCHSGSSENPGLTVSRSTDIPAGDSTAIFDVSGLSATMEHKGLRIVSSDDNISLRDSAINATQPVDFSSTEDPVNISYCMMEGSGGFEGARFWHCDTLSIDRAVTNSAPRFTSDVPSPLPLTRGGDAFTFTVVAVDDDNTIPTITVSSSNDSVVRVTPDSDVQGSGTFSLNPEAVGNNVTITIAASAGEASVTQSFQVSVVPEPEPENAAPQITSPNPGTQTLIVGRDSFTLTPMASDDVAVISLDVTANNNNVSIVGPDDSGQYTISPVSPGESEISIEASDGELDATPQTFTVIVNPAPIIQPDNEAPRITSSNPGTQGLTVGADPLTLTLEFVDEFPDLTRVNLISSNPDVVEVSAGSENPPPATDVIAPVTPLPMPTPGMRTFTLTPLIAGESTMRFQVTDNISNTVTQEFLVSVAIGNQPPQFELASEISLLSGESTRIDLAIRDEDTASVDIDIEVEDSDIVDVDVIGNTAINISALRVGETSVTVTVEDEQDVDTTATVLVTVTSSNQIPEAQADEFVLAPGLDNIRLDVLANDSDRDGDALSIVLDASLSDEGVSISVVDNEVSYELSGDLTSDDSFSYRARDTSDAESSSVEVTLTPSDLDGDERVDALDNCPLLPNPDQQDRDSDDIGDICDPDPDGDGVPGDSSIPFESGRELVEAECLTCHLTGVSSAPLFGDDAEWMARIASAGGLPEDLLPSVVNGVGAMPAFGSRYSARELIQAIRYLSGVETSGPIADLDGDMVDNTIDNCRVVRNTDQQDSDSNGIGDVCDEQPVLLDIAPVLNANNQ